MQNDRRQTRRHGFHERKTESFGHRKLHKQVRLLKSRLQVIALEKTGNRRVPPFTQMLAVRPITDENGEATINLTPGDYVIIATDFSFTKTVLPDPLGVSASDLLCGELKRKHLQQIVKANGKKVPGKCLGCGWTGEVSLYHRTCPKCGNNITKQRSTERDAPFKS